MKTALKVFFLISVFFWAARADAQLNQGTPRILDDVGVDEKLGDRIPLDLKFANSDGDSVTIGNLLEDGRPVLLNPVYYDCPTLCGLLLDAVFNVVHDLAWSPAREYTIITYSIDPSETHEDAARAKELYLEDLARPGAEDGWYFLTGSEEAIIELSDAVGFRYKYDERTGEYMHMASIMMISPAGVITRYLYGLSFNEFDLRNALYEAADGRVGSAIERVILYCFTYDPASQSYVLFAINVMKLGGLATVLILGIFLAFMWRRYKGSSQPPKIEFQK